MAARSIRGYGYFGRGARPEARRRLWAALALVRTRPKTALRELEDLRGSAVDPRLWLKLWPALVALRNGRRVVAERWIMTLADINKWISGETEAFPLQTPSAASVDSNSGEERSTAQPSIQKFVHLAIAAVIGAFASAALVHFVLMRAPVEPSRADEKSQSSGSGTLVTGGRVLGDVVGARPITASPTEINSTLAMPIVNQPTAALPDARLAAPRPERRPAAPKRASRRDRPRDSVSDQAEREETARLMRDELRQRGVAADAASGSGHPE